MRTRERLISFQNKAERNFNKNKNIRTILNFILAILLFFASTMFAGLSLPVRLIIKRLSKKAF